MRAVRLTAERLRAVLSYNPVTGKFTRIMRLGSRALVGDVVGSHTSGGYLQITIDGEKHELQRLAWLYMTGRWPVADVDHRDLRKDNNVWDNLRAATRSQNKANVPPPRTNTSGIKGVRFDQTRGKWVALISVRGHRINLGRFGSRDEAAAAYRESALANFGEFARLA